MKKFLEKTALVVLVCVGLLFATYLLVSAAGGEQTAALSDPLLLSVTISLSAIFFAAAVTALICAFSDAKKPPLLTLFSDKTSATRVTHASAKRLVKKTAEPYGAVKVLKSTFSQDDKGGLELKVTLNVRGADAEETADKLRCALTESFTHALGVKLDKIDFVIRRFRPRYKADGEKVRLAAAVLKANRESCSLKPDAVTVANESADAIATAVKAEPPVQTFAPPVTDAIADADERDDVLIETHMAAEPDQTPETDAPQTPVKRRAPRIAADAAAKSKPAHQKPSAPPAQPIPPAPPAQS